MLRFIDALFGFGHRSNPPVHKALTKLYTRIQYGEWGHHWHNCWMGHLAIVLDVGRSEYMLQRDALARQCVKAMGFRRVDDAVRYNDHGTTSKDDILRLVQMGIDRTAPPRKEPVKVTDPATCVDTSRIHITDTRPQRDRQHSHM